VASREVLWDPAGDGFANPQGSLDDDGENHEDDHSVPVTKTINPIIIPF